MTTLHYNLQKYICKIMEEKKRSPTEEDNDEEGRRSSRRKKAKVCPELTRLSLCCYINAMIMLECFRVHNPLDDQVSLY